MQRRLHPLFWPGLVVPVLLVGVIVGLIFFATGCVSNPVAAASDPEQKAYAVYGEFVITEEQAALAMQDGSVPLPVKQAIRGADAKAKPSADSLLKAFHDYESAVAAAKASGATTPAATLETVTANLQNWIAQAQGDVTGLIAAVKAAPGH